MKGRALSVDNIMNMKFSVMEFDGEWMEAFGTPERSGSWIIWGKSGNGKTSFALQLSKYLTKFGRVAYNSLEEGARLSMRRALNDVRMAEVKKRIILLHKEPISELKVRLLKKKSPDIIIIDSIQYSGLNASGWKELCEQFPKKLFIAISHEDGIMPAGRTGQSIRYYSDMKIRVEGFRAINVSRAGTKTTYLTVWHQGAFDYWGE